MHIDKYHKNAHKITKVHIKSQKCYHFASLFCSQIKILVADNMARIYPEADDNFHSQISQISHNKHNTFSQNLYQNIL